MLLLISRMLQTIVFASENHELTFFLADFGDIIDWGPIASCLVSLVRKIIFLRYFERFMDLRDGNYLKLYMGGGESD